MKLKVQILIIITTLFLGCSKEKINPIVGTWKLSNIFTASGSTIEKDIFEIFAIDTPCIKFIELTFEKDGTLLNNSPSNCPTEGVLLEGNSTYSLDGNILNITGPSGGKSKFEYKVNNNILEWLISENDNGVVIKTRIVFIKK
ncbi:MAG: DUF5004 domain-containing protein [Spirosomataceae bacterium]